MPKILFVTNDTRKLSSWQVTLRSCGHELDMAISGSEALGRAVLGLPNLIVLDKIEISPEVFINQLKQNAKTEHIPVISLDPQDASGPGELLSRIQSLLSPRRVLVAEDDRQMAHVLEMILKKSGYEVKVTYDGTETLREIKAWQPHLVVLDIMLPIVDGFHICQTMIEDHSFDPRPKILIVSGRGSDWDQNLGAACGAEDYLVKPFSNEYLLQKVREILADAQNK